MKQIGPSVKTYYQFTANQVLCLVLSGFGAGAATALAAQGFVAAAVPGALCVAAAMTTIRSSSTAVLTDRDAR